LNIPNCLTLSRIILSPIFLIVYLSHNPLHIDNQLLPYILLLLFGVSEITDMLDGFLARHYDQVTDLGKIMDPMADSIARTSAFLTFTLPPVNLPMILVFAFLYRDAVVSTVRTTCALKGFALAARLSGKLKAIIQAIAIFIILVLYLLFSLHYVSLQDLQFYSCVVVSFAAVYALFSGLDYIISNREYILSAMRGKKPYDL
jgi:CDP-diacylglycerol---glycerol-3-phosphate 3-phosphatidyltransferase